jgi:hypothetical protein
MTTYRWAGWSPVEVWVRCVGGHLHTLRWEAGELTLVDHGLSDDPASPCLALHATWHRYADDLLVLTAAARDAADALRLGAGPSGIPEARPAHPPAGNLPQPPWTLLTKPRGDHAAVAFAVPLDQDEPPVGGADPLHDIGVLLHLGFGLGERLVTGVAATWADRVAADPSAPVPAALTVAVEERARRALDTWWGDGGAVTITADDPASLTPDPADDDRVHLTVPVRWLADVWCRDVAIAHDRFVLEIEEAADDHLTVRAADGYHGGDRTVTVALPIEPHTQDAPELQPPTEAPAPAGTGRPDWDEEAAEAGTPFLVRRLAVTPAYSTLYVHSGFTDVWATHENPLGLVHDDARQSGRRVGVLDRALVDIDVPGYGQPDTPVTVEIWPHAPPDDILEWDHEVDVDLDINGGLLLQGGGGGAECTTTVPAGEFRLRFSGRHYDRAAAYDGPPEFRLRLWRRPRPNPPVLRRGWPGFDHSTPISEPPPVPRPRTPLQSQDVVRTDFSDEATWLNVRDAVTATGTGAFDGYQPILRVVDDPAWDGASADDVLATLGEQPLGFVVVIDNETLTTPDHAVLVLSLGPRDRGEQFRSLPAAIPSIEANLSIANLSWEDFARAVDNAGVFRGF